MKRRRITRGRQRQRIDFFRIVVQCNEGNPGAVTKPQLGGAR